MLFAVMFIMKTTILVMIRIMTVITTTTMIITM